MKYTIQIIVYLFLSLPIWGQATLTDAELGDFTERAIRQVLIFQDNVEAIAAGKNSKTTRKRAINSTVVLFSKDATIEEQSKNSRRKKRWQPKKYLNSLLKRGSTTPTVVNFNFIDEDILKAKDLVTKVNDDGTISYTGKMRFNQFYCRLKAPDQLTEPSYADPTANCTYSDLTKKEVGIEIVLSNSAKGKFWVTLITYIKVIKVTDA